MSKCYRVSENIPISMIISISSQVQIQKNNAIKLYLTLQLLIKQLKTCYNYALITFICKNENGSSKHSSGHK